MRTGARGDPELPQTNGCTFALRKLSTAGDSALSTVAIQSRHVNTFVDKFIDDIIISGSGMKLQIFSCRL